MSRPAINRFGCWALLCTAAAGGAQQDLAAGKFLVASPGVLSPNFTQAVVLLIHYDKQGAMGLVINRQTKVPLSRSLEGLKAAEGRTDPTYFGGPVGITGVLALLRSKAVPEGAEHVFADVHLASSRELLEKTLATGGKSSVLRVYLGYSGWAAGQLEREVELGVWQILPADAGMAFDPDPDSVWPRLIKRQERPGVLRAETGILEAYQHVAGGGLQ